MCLLLGLHFHYLRQSIAVRPWLLSDRSQLERQQDLLDTGCNFGAWVRTVRVHYGIDRSIKNVLRVEVNVGLPRVPHLLSEIAYIGHTVLDNMKSWWSYGQPRGNLASRHSLTVSGITLTELLCVLVLTCQCAIAFLFCLPSLQFAFANSLRGSVAVVTSLLCIPPHSPIAPP